MMYAGCNLPFEDAALYQIVVGSRLSNSATEKLSGLTIVENDDQHTVLEGEIRDQAELMGIIDTLHAYHHSIIELRVINPEEEKNK